MKTIPLNNRYGVKIAEAIVDDEDYEWLSAMNWHRTGLGYAAHGWAENGKPRLVLMHRLLTCALGFLDKVDHINGNRLDNRMENLRLCNDSINGLNPNNRGKGGKSGIRGVYQHHRGRWSARIMVRRKNVWLGLFDNKEDAARAVSMRLIEEVSAFGGRR